MLPLIAAARKILLNLFLDGLESTSRDARPEVYTLLSVSLFVITTLWIFHHGTAPRLDRKYGPADPKPVPGPVTMRCVGSTKRRAALTPRPARARSNRATQLYPGGCPGVLGILGHGCHQTV